jgi:predicted MFS family arabinose efflux permease
MMNLTKAEAPIVARGRLPGLVWLIVFASFWIKCAAYFSVPFLSIFLTKNTNLSLPVIGLIVGAQPLAALIGGFLGGHLSDRFGRWHILFVSLGGSALIYSGFFLTARHLAADPYAAGYFALLNLLAGWFSSFFWPVTQALIGDLAAEEQRPRIYRYRYVITNIGGGLGPPLGVSLGVASASTAFLATAMLYAVFLTVVYFCSLSVDIKQNGRHKLPGKSLKQSLIILRRDKALRWLLLSAIFFGASYAQIESNLSQVLYRAFPDGVKLFSLLVMMNGIGVLVLQPVATLCESRMNAKTMMMLGTTAFCLGCLEMAILPDYKAAILMGIVIITVGEVMVVPTLSVLVDRMAPANMRGTYFGAATLRQLGPSFGPSAGGVVLTYSGAVSLFAFMGLLGALSAMFVSCFSRIGEPENG